MHQIEIENSRAPAAPGPAAEVTLDCLEAAEHGFGIEIAFDDRHGIGEIPAGAAMRRVENDLRSVEQAKVPVEPGNCRFDDLRGPAETAMRPVRADGDGIKVCCA